MQKPLHFLAAASVAVMLSLPVAAQESEAPDLNQVIATVNGVNITLGHLAVAKASLPEDYAGLPAEVLFTGILDQMIQQTALASSFDGDLPPRVEYALENERRSLTAGEAIETVLSSMDIEPQLQAAYEEQYLNGDQAEEFNAAHILVETEEEALAIIADLEGGADFAETAKEKSTGPSGARGGDLGWFGAGAMVPAFEAAVFGLEVGAVSPPVETQFGFHVIKLIEKREKQPPTLEEVRQELEMQLRRDAIVKHIDGIVANAAVDRSVADGMDPKILDQIDLTK